MTSSTDTVATLREPAPYAAYTDRLAAGEIAYQRCVPGGHAFFYPRVLCPECGSTDVVWEASAGLGTVYALTWVTQRDAGPYAVCLVDLDEGFRVMSTIVDGDPERVAIGDRVRGRIESAEDEPRVVFAQEVTDDE